MSPKMDDFNRHIEFQAWPKIPRFDREVIITEKIDGTNAAIVITEDGWIGAQSRKRLISPGDDNFGFARWVWQNIQDLMELGPGHHFGEWYGSGIQRGYGLDEKRFALFNTGVWTEGNLPPSICGVVPVLVRGNGGSLNMMIADALQGLALNGSVAVPGFMHPEGIVIYHTAARMTFKVLLGGDDKPKGV
jgi:hypothetical protein